MSGIQLFEGATVVVVSKIVVVVVEDVVDSGTVLTLSSITESFVPHKTNTKTKAINLKLFFITNNYIKEPFWIF